MKEHKINNQINKTNKLSNGAKSIERNITGCKKKSEESVIELFLNYLSIEAEIITIEKECNGEADAEIKLSNGASLSVEVTEFTLEKQKQTEATCQRIINELNQYMIDNKISPQEKCFIHIMFHTHNKISRNIINDINSKISGFFSNSYNTKKNKIIYTDRDIDVKYMPTGFITRDLKIDHNEENKWKFETQLPSYGEQEIKNQLNNLILNKNKKSSKVDILLIFERNNPFFNSTWPDTINKELAKLNFNGVYWIEIIEDTMLFKATSNKKIIPQSTLHGYPFHFIVQTIKQLDTLHNT